MCITTILTILAKCLLPWNPHDTKACTTATRAQEPTSSAIISTHSYSLNIATSASKVSHCSQHLPSSGGYRVHSDSNYLYCICYLSGYFPLTPTDFFSTLLAFCICHVLFTVTQKFRTIFQDTIKQTCQTSNKFVEQLFYKKFTKTHLFFGSTR